MPRPLCIDLCCGSGGWAAGFIEEGYEVHGYDIQDQPKYPGVFIRADVRKLDGHRFTNAALIVASPPCEEFSRHQMPWTKRRNPPEPDLTIVEACLRIAREAGVPMILENVRMAQHWLGRARWHDGAFYLWGDVPALMPYRSEGRKKEGMSSSWKLERARVPKDLASHIARIFLPSTEVA